MPIPDYQTLMLPVLKLAAEQELTNKACVERLADQFSLVLEERTQLLPSGKQTIIANRVHWAVTYLTKAGLLDRPKRGAFVATNRGKHILGQNLQSIDNKFLEQFQEFWEFQARSKDKGKSQEVNPLEMSSIYETVATPEEQIEIAS
jgi:restriction system protein